jgi:hypothetical protein
LLEFPVDVSKDLAHRSLRIPTKEIGDSDLMPIMIGAQRSWAVSC